MAEIESDQNQIPFIKSKTNKKKKNMLYYFPLRYGKLALVIFLDNLQTRKFVQSLAFDPHENKSLSSKLCPMTGSQGSFPSGKQKKVCGKHKDNKALLFALEYQITR